MVWSLSEGEATPAMAAASRLGISGFLPHDQRRGTEAGPSHSPSWWLLREGTVLISERRRLRTADLNHHGPQPPAHTVNSQSLLTDLDSTRG